MAETAKAFGPAPSVRLGVRDPVEAYLLDEALTLRLLLGPLKRDERGNGMRVEHDPLIAAEVADWHMDLLRREGRIH